MPPLFFFNDTATTEIYTLSLHDALPIFAANGDRKLGADPGGQRRYRSTGMDRKPDARQTHLACDPFQYFRSEEHTSEFQSHLNLVCRLLLEKKKKNERKQQTE